MVTAAEQIRERILERLGSDLIGPKWGPAEVIDERPSARYLTGILYPQQSEFSEEEDETIASENGGGSPSSEEEELHQATSLFRAFKPAACGFSFSVDVSTEQASIELTVRFGRYASSEAHVPGGAGHRPKLSWTRTAVMPPIICIPVRDGVEESDIADGLILYRRIRREGSRATITLQFVNAYRESESEGPNSDRATDVSDRFLVYDMISRERACLFQFEASVTCGVGCRFVPRKRAFNGNDEDERIADLIYRDFAEYAVGHTASAEWTPIIDPERIALSWFPRSVVKRMDAGGDEILSKSISATKLGRLHGLELAIASRTDLIAALDAVADAYASWIAHQRTRIAGELDQEKLREQATKNLARCEAALDRIRAGIELLNTNPLVAEAFRLANRAMYIQAAWAGGRPSAQHDLDPATAHDFQWRPFQMAFALLCLPSSAQRDHPDRDVFDLIWFPTGGGKTEAYLLLAAFVMFHRRLTLGERGCGVGVMMRYTLRTLTIQQFQRAAALATACEQLRIDSVAKLGGRPFSIGLWVGSDSTPNTYSAAAEALRDLDPKSTPKQLTRCPVCRGELEWRADAVQRAVVCECKSPICRSQRPNGSVPVLTVDEDLYAQPPSLLIGTVDKFAQVVRRSEAGTLFGTDGSNAPPDLIIQDELHLIGGPLGSLTGLYESAIDELCRTEDGRAKIVGSTATIRRADEQVLQIFNRSAFQFPPPAIDWSNSCFASVDRSDAGRMYVGVTTAGRSEKFALQAVSASLLQSGCDPAIAGDAEFDAYRTLVAYFNSLKVLGGALVLMEDDVRITVGALAQQRGESPRQLGNPEELTSRKASAEIPVILERLGKDQTDPECVDVLLASNMLSVGVDIPRLGLMLVNGQPKFMAEYIQATSRVGRRAPGLVITIYNNNKIRDRAHYETFSSWHGALYRSVEPSSVTPFAPRARDKAIHAPLVALVRHLISPSGPGIGRKDKPRILSQVDVIVERIKRVDPDEAKQTREELTSFVEDWIDGVEAGRIRFYWSDRRFNASLLMSAEAAAARRAVGKSEAAAVPTPNSVRNVEPGVDFVLRERA